MPQHPKEPGELNEKQKLFCKEYLVDLSGAKAAIRAGYSEKTAQEQASRMLSKVNIQDYLQQLMSERAKRVQVTADYVLSTIIDTIERCKQAKPVLNQMGLPVLVEGPDGTRAAAYKFDATNVLKGTELLGKHLKLFTDVVESKVEESVKYVTVYEDDPNAQPNGGTEVRETNTTPEED